MLVWPWVSVVVALASVAVALYALRTNGKRELRSFNRKLLTDHVTAVLVLVDVELSRLGSGSMSSDGFDVSGTRYMELSYQLLSHKTVIEVVSPSCAQAITDSVDRISKFRSDTDGTPYPLLGAMHNGLALMRGQLLVTHLRAVSHPHLDEKEIAKRAAELKAPLDAERLGQLSGPGLTENPE